MRVSDGQRGAVTMQPRANARVEYVDSETGERLGRNYFHDPDLAYYLDPTRGGRMRPGYACGRTLREWEIALCDAGILPSAES
jgi:hypothetical protein